MVQRTFTLIPQFPGRAPSPDKPPVRPMTSKQAQKAYKAANRGPRLSRAEAWKQERAEQERIRKEFEKEKAAAKAKVAREKKKQKELAEKEQKRKKGLPLVNVRPSQDTIARFVRGNGTEKKRDADGRDASKVDTIQEEEEEETPETSREATVEEEDGTGEPALKKPRLENVQEVEESTRDGGMDGVVEDLPQRDSLEPRRLDNIQEMEDDTADAAERSMMANESPRPPPQAPKLDILGIEEDDELDADFEEDLALEMLEDLEAAVDKQSTQRRQLEAVTTNDPPPILKPSTPHQPAGTGPHPANRYEHDLGLQRSTPPPVPVAQAPLAQSLHQTPASPSPSPPRQAPPMSTQAILSNFDDFFPSSSQQARELEEELFDDIASSAPTRLPPIDEIEEEEPEEEPYKPVDDQAPSPVLDPASDSPPGPQRRFFTSSGSHELMCLALHRSRRSAALEEIQRRERARMHAGMIAQVEAESLEEARRDQLKRARCTKDAGNNKPKQPQLGVNWVNCEKPRASSAAKIPDNGGSPKHIRPSEPAKAQPWGDNKEQRPPPDETFGPSASQESYGGDWVDEIALELMI